MKPQGYAEHAQRHYLMVSQEAGEGTPISAIAWHLNRLDDQSVPHSEHLDNHYGPSILRQPIRRVPPTRAHIGIWLREACLSGRIMIKNELH